MADPMPTLTPAQLDDVRRIFDVAASYVDALLAVLLWDTLSTLPIEYKYVWMRRWTPLKLLYLANRYWTLALMFGMVYLINAKISPTFCSRYAVLEPAGTVVTVLVCSGILTIRTYAIYNKSVRVLLFLLLCVVTEAAIMAAASARFTGFTLPGVFDGCVATVKVSGGKLDTKGLVVAFWAAPLAFDTLILGLTVYRVVTLRRRCGGRIPILATFLADAGFYYFIIFSADVVNIVFLANTNASVQTLNSPMSTALTSLMASRIVLNLHVSQDTSKSETPTPPAPFGSGGFPLTPLPNSAQPGPKKRAPLSFTSFNSLDGRTLTPTLNAPIVAMLVPGATELPAAVKVALRGLGKDEVEMGLRRPEEVLDGDAGGGGRRSSRGMNSMEREGLRVRVNFETETKIERDEEWQAGTRDAQ